MLDEALEAFRVQTGGVARFVPGARSHNDPRFDAQVELEVHDQKIKLLAEMKNVDRRIALAQIKTQLDQVIDEAWPDYQPLLIAPYVTEALAEECRRLDLPFLDTAGNPFIRTKSTLLYIVGRPRPEHAGKRDQQVLKIGGMKVIFALLCQPEFVALTYRQIADAAKVALGTLGPVLKNLESRGFIHRKAKGADTLSRIEELLQEWVIQYPAILRPKLNARRYAADREKALGLNLNELHACWGGEVAAERLTGYLKPEHFTIYAHGEVNPILQQGMMRLALGGNIEILDAFWNPCMYQTEMPLAPPLLIYADLMMTGDDRNIETAKILYERHLKPLTTTR